MATGLIPSEPAKDFEAIKRIDGEKVEYWFARELMLLLGYSEWRNFEDVIKKAMQACLQSGQYVDDHFVDATKMVPIGSNTVRRVKDWKLDRYACYLIAQNGDSRKQQIALAQTYFAIQTRRQELFGAMVENERRVFIRGEVSNENKKLFSTAKKVGVRNFGWFNDAGYRGLYDRGIADLEQYKGIKKGELLDRAGSTELAANLFRITQTDEKIKLDNVSGEYEATKTHFVVGRKVRQIIKDIGGSMPEELPPETHISKVRRELKQLSRHSKNKPTKQRKA